MDVTDANNDGGVDDEGSRVNTKIQPFSKPSESRLLLHGKKLFHIQVTQTSTRTYTEKALQEEVLKVIVPMIYYEGEIAPIRTENIVVVSEVEKSPLETNFSVESENNNEGDQITFHPMKLCFTVHLIDSSRNEEVG